MSRGSEIAIGITTLIGTVLLALVAVVDGENSKPGLAGFLGLSAFLGLASVALLVRRGRHITMRITAAGICLAIVYSGLVAIRDSGVSGRGLVWMLIGVDTSGDTLSG